MTPTQFDALLGQFVALQTQVDSAIRVLESMRPQPVEDHRPRERVHKTFGREHRVPVDPDEAARLATAPAAATGYISPEAQGAQESATSGKADGSA